MSKKKNLLKLFSLQAWSPLVPSLTFLWPHSMGVQADLHGWLQTYHEAFTIDHTNTIPQCRSICAFKCQLKTYMEVNLNLKG